jgi:TetR/AcrR family transcriptional regulator
MDKQETKKKVFMAAADLFATKGYYQVSVREICEAAGVTKPVLYYYFKDKEDLLEALINELQERSKELIDGFVKSDAGFEENLEGVYNFYVRFAEDYPYLIRLTTLVQFSPLPAKIKNLSSQRFDSFLKRIMNVIEQGKEEGFLNKNINTDMTTLSIIAPFGIIIGRSVLLKDPRLPLQKSLKEYFNFWKEQFIKKETRSS